MNKLSKVWFLALSILICFNVCANQIQVGNSFNFTPASLAEGTTKSWTMPWWVWPNTTGFGSQFSSNTYTYSDHYANRLRKLTTNSIIPIPGEGGIVLHFSSSQNVAMSLEISLSYVFAGTGGHNMDVYFSDDDWNVLTPMTGGTFAGGTETNTSWHLLRSDRRNTAASVTSSLNAQTFDGDFWIRLDFSAADGFGNSYIEVSNLVVKGTVAARLNPVKVIDFTPVNNTTSTIVNWAMPFVDWTNDSQLRREFADSVYSSNVSYVNKWRKICNISESDRGGVVWHFKSATDIPMDLLLKLKLEFGGLGYSAFDVYFSDENDYSNLSPVSGGNLLTKETNEKWHLIFSKREFNVDHRIIQNQQNLHTLDGDFYIRVDMGGDLQNELPNTSLNEFMVSGTVDYDQLSFQDRAVFGVNGHVYGNSDVLSNDLGAKWVRRGFEWNTTETFPGVYNNSGVSQILDDIAVGMNVIVVFTGDNVNYPSRSEDLAAYTVGFANFCSYIVSQLGNKNIIYEIMNEPEVFGIGLPNYCYIAKVTSQAIKTADAQALVAAISNGWFNPDFLNEAILNQQILKEGYVDFVSFHGYHRAGGYGGYLQPSAKMSEMSLKENIQWIKDLIQSARQSQGFTNPVGVILSETGIAMDPGGPRELYKTDWRMYVSHSHEQAAYLARHYFSVLASPVDLSIWYKDMWGETGFSLYLTGTAISNIPSDSYLELRDMGKVFKKLTPIFDVSPVFLQNDKFDITVLAQDASQQVLVKKESFVKKAWTDEEELIIPLWLQVEAFQGQVLISRVMSGDYIEESWRAIDASDKVAADVNLVIDGFDNTLYDAKIESVLDGFPISEPSISWTGNTLSVSGVSVSAMPVLVRVKKRAVPLNCEGVNNYGYLLSSDTNSDCRIDINDISVIAALWLESLDIYNISELSAAPREPGNSRWIAEHNIVSLDTSAKNVGDAVSYSINSANGLFDKCWARHEQIQVSGSSFAPNIDNNHGGIIYKFVAGSPCAMNLNIVAAIENSYWGGRKAVLYFSDENDWSLLNDPLEGSRWDSWPKEFESNPNWQQLSSWQYWGVMAQPNLSGTVYTNDGTFYIRVDLTQVMAPVSSIAFSGISLSGTVLPAAPQVNIIQTGGQTKVSESGSFDTYRVSLNTIPTNDVIVTVTPDSELYLEGLNNGESVSLVFTPQDYSAKTVRVYANDDSITESGYPFRHTGLIYHTVSSTVDMRYNNLLCETVAVEITDNDIDCSQGLVFFPVADINNDCAVDMKDIAAMASQWQSCNLPGDLSCQSNWNIY